MESRERVVELVKRLNGIAIISSDIADKDIQGMELEQLSSYVIDYLSDKPKPAVIDRNALLEIMKIGKKDEVPMQIEVIRATDFSPIAKEMDADYSIENVGIDKTNASVGDFTSYFNYRLERLRTMITSNRNGRMSGMVNSISSLNSYTKGREICIVGMVYEKAVTKNGHILITIEDESGQAKVLFPAGDSRSKERSSTFSEANRVVDDEVLAVKGKLAETGDIPFVIANSIVYPDVPARQRKRSENDLAIAFLSDLHVGSKMFLERQFNKFLEWLNGSLDYRREVAGKVKYIMIAGDLVDGIGIYPRQEKELSIDDVYKQYTVLTDLLSKVPEYIQIFMLPGNHDAVQRAEPQPIIPSQLVKEASLSNLHLLTNPGYATMEGLKVLGYHGTSLISVMRAIPGCSYLKPETAMVELLKRRHLSPIYGDNPIVPSRKDSMVIDEVPDIMHMGHIHKNGETDYHGTLVINSGTWQGRTSLQIKNGIVPSPALLPVYQTKLGEMEHIDFNTFVS